MISETRIKEEIKENNYILFCQVSVDDEDYKQLIDYARMRVKGISLSILPHPDLILSLALVQVAIRRYNEGKFWKCFLEEIGFEVSSAKLNYAGQIFIKTVREYGLFEYKREGNTSQMYVESIKTHAFITNAYMEGFFDFSYAFFENNLFRSLSDDLRDDLEELAVFMESTLKSGKEDSISGDDLNKASKSYKLLKSTRAVFAYCDQNILFEIYRPILAMIDAYFYDNIIPEACQNRYETGFKKWCDSKQDGEKESSKRGTDTRRIYSHKPYIKVMVDKEYSFIVVPPQKFRTTECDGSAVVNITISGYKKVVPLELYKSFGIYISEEIQVPIPGVFEDIVVDINGIDGRYYKYPSSNYRVFNDDWKSISKLCPGHNYLLVRKDITVSWNDDSVLIDSTEE